MTDKVLRDGVLQQWYGRSSWVEGSRAPESPGEERPRSAGRHHRWRVQQPRRGLRALPAGHPCTGFESDDTARGLVGSFKVNGADLEKSYRHAISCGIYGYPLPDAAEVAFAAVHEWLGTHPDSGIEEIIWVLRGPDVMAAFRGASNAPGRGVAQPTSDRHTPRARLVIHAQQETMVTDPQDTFDFVIIGAGAAGEAALELARERGHSVAVVDRDLFGGSCAFWACMPSKALLHAAAVHDAGGDFPWQKASEFRDYMISREDTDYPSDANHESRYRSVGAEPIRGTARLDGPGTVRVALTDGGERVLHARDIVIAVGSHSRIPDIVGLDQIDYWDNHEGHRHTRAAAQPAHHGRRTHRHRAGPGLRPLRRAGHARGLQSRASSPATTPATPRSCRQRSSATAPRS